LDEGLFHAYKHLKGLVSALSVEIAYYKLNFTVHVEMYRLDEEGEVVQEDVFPFRGQGFGVTRETKVIPELRRVCGDVERNVDEFLMQGSGWVVHRPIYMEAEVVQCLPLHGGRCGFHEVKYERKSGITPLAPLGRSPPDDGMCFYYAIAAHFSDPEADLQRLANFSLRHVVVNRPDKQVSLKNITLFEEENKDLDLAINVVYKDEDGSIIPVRASKNIHAHNMIVLLLFNTFSEENDADVMHYSLVRDPRRLFAVRGTSKWGKRVTANVFICWNCFNTCRSAGAYENHVKFCHNNNCQQITLPRFGQVVSFNSEEKCSAKIFRSAYMLFFDFEALQVIPEKPCTCTEQVLKNTREWEEMTDEEKADRVMEHGMLEGERTELWLGTVFEAEGQGRKGPAKPPGRPRGHCWPRMCTHKTQIVKEQPPFAYSYVLVDRDGRVLEEKTYVGADCADNLIMSVLNLADKYLPSLSPGKSMDGLTEEQEKEVARTKNCYLCGKAMYFSDKARDHDHLTGEFLGVAHNICNLQRREQSALTCFAHNFSGYDSHFLIRSVNKFPKRIRSIQAIPMNTQKFKSIILNRRIRFLDSCQFLLSSLANLVDTLKMSKHEFQILDSMVACKEEKELLLRKGVYPYSFATSEADLRAASCLPGIEEFTNDLTGEVCSLEDYEHAEKVWEVFGCLSMMDYTALYVKSDVFLLAEVVLDFRNNIWKSFGLDACQYLSLPHMAKDILLKETGAEIELVSDQEMSDFLQKNIRGGLSFVNLRHAERVTPRQAATPRERRVLIYLDAVNLYGKAMSFPLPLHSLRWMSDDELLHFDVEKQVSFEDGPGFIFEVDMEYPPGLQLQHNSFPLAAESMDVSWSDLSPYSRRCLRALKPDLKREYRAKKLTSTFRDRYKNCRTASVYKLKKLNIVFTNPLSILAGAATCCTGSTCGSTSSWA
jgi:hypothetical protein